ncbi:lysophospholipid acyltransferase family protein [Caldanaerobacter sp.]|uniref:lysophospholipid acyltransferase family protein n=1 Tax=Caldanaerobacter sp. TaxID=2930036 RepID=UPI003C75F4EC
MFLLYRVLRRIGIALLKIFYSFKVERDGNLSKGSYIFVSNHQSLLDPVAVVCAIKTPIIFLASSELFNIYLLKPFLLIDKAIPIKKESADLKAIKKALERLKEGYSIGIFPEGGISPKGVIEKIYEGAMYLAYKSGKPLVPVVVQGTKEVLPLGKYVPKLRGKIKVKVGEPIFPDLNKDIKAEIAELKEKIEARMKEMLTG